MTGEEIHLRYADDLVRSTSVLVGPFDAQDVDSDGASVGLPLEELADSDQPRAYLYPSVPNEERSHRSTLRGRVRELRNATSDVVTPDSTDVDVLADASTLRKEALT